MKIIIDMCLSPEWSSLLQAHGYESAPWSTVGLPTAKDSEIMDWARRNGYVVFTHDLDFGTELARTNARGPSVIQVREHDVLPEGMGDTVLEALDQFHDELERGALVTIEWHRPRARLLPIHREP